MKHFKLPLLLSLLMWLSACAKPVFDTAELEFERDLMPDEVSAQAGEHDGQQVLWGGMVLDTRNLENSTQIEVLAYPLNRYQRPSLSSRPRGRFIIIQPGYLEAVNYSQGRQVSVLGTLTESRRGKIGATEYDYPVVEVQKLHLWPEGSEPRTTFHFGFGIQL